MKKVISIVFFTFVSGAVNAADISAVLDWSDVRHLATSVTARINGVNVRPGMRVKQGQSLVDIDRRYFDIRKKRATSQLKALKLTLDEAQLEQDRAIELYDRTVLSQFDRRKADRELAIASANYSEAISELEQAKLDLEYSMIKAPYDALVLNVPVTAGEVVLNNLQAKTLVSVARDDEMLSVASVTGEQLKDINHGKALEIAFRGDWLTGKVDSIETTGQQRDGMPLFNLKVKFSVTPELRPRAGEASAIRLP